ncbi:MAG TPA: glycosyltransferase [Alphaproteobacteria bacterium]|nr:glycosyltransferase [Alphaproteobacteria bacterium]
MVRVIQLITASRIAGGMESFLARLAPALQRAGLAQLAIAQPGGDMGEYLRSHGIETLEYSLKKRDPFSIWGVRRAFRKFAPNLALSWLPRAAQRVPSGPWVQVAQVGWYRGLDCYERAERMIVPTPDMARHFSSLGFKGEITVLPHFANVERVSPVLRRTFETPDAAPLVLGLGRFDTIKGFDIALRAVAMLPDAYLWLAGEGEEDAALHALTAELGIGARVRFLGWRRDPEALIDQADVVVVPSRQEALGLTILEAWAQGVPVVASDTPGPSYLIEPEVSGILFRREDPAALAAALARVLGSPALGERLIAGGKNRLATTFSESAAVEAYLDYFERVVREARKKSAG